MVEKTKKDYWRDWILGKEIDRPLPRPWTKLTNKEIDKLAKWAYISYHCRLSFLLKAIFSVSSFSELKRKVFAFLDMLFRQENFSKEDKKFVAYSEVGRKLNFYRKLKLN